MFDLSNIQGGGKRYRRSILLKLSILSRDDLKRNLLSVTVATKEMLVGKVYYARMKTDNSFVKDNF